MKRPKKLLRAPIWWFGGKGNMASKLLRLMPPHRCYVEPFGGAASLLFAKAPAEVETYNDLDAGLVGFFRVLRDPAGGAELHRRAKLMPYSRQEYDEYRRTWAEQDDPVERAWRWFVVARMSFAGLFASSFGTVTTTARRGRAGDVSKWQSVADELPALTDRLLRVQIEQQDWRNILKRYNGPDYLAYCDPPYITNTRRSGGYTHELSNADHTDLVRVLFDYDGMVMLSGYDSETYAPLTEAGWDVTRYKTVCHAAARTRATGIQDTGAGHRMQPRTECVWRNPAAMQAIRERDGVLDMREVPC